MPEKLAVIPPLSEGDTALVESLLRGAGFWFMKEDGFGEVPARLFVKAHDLRAVKKHLASFRVSRPTGGGGPIPW